MAGSPARRASYKDTLQPALHRRFSSTATLLLAVSYIEALLLASWSSCELPPSMHRGIGHTDVAPSLADFWSWFPIGPAGVRTAIIFSCGLAILVLRIAHYHVGLKTTESGLQTLGSALLSLQTYETGLWYGVSSSLFCPVFLFSMSDSANLRWITYFSGDRARLNERPLFLACYLGACALMQTISHYRRDVDRLDLSLPTKPKAGEVGKKLGILPASFQTVLLQLPAVFGRSVRSAASSVFVAILLYHFLLRSFAWGWTLALLRPFYNLPRTSMLPPSWPIDLYLLGRCVYAGTLINFLWAAGNTAFSIFMVKEPLKNGNPLTSESKDPNGSLLNGLKSKKLSIQARTQSFAMWELALIAQDFEARRQAIYCDIDRKDGPMWAQVYAICMGLLKDVEARVDEYGKAPAAVVAEPAALAPKQRFSAPLREDPIFSKKSQPSGLVEKAIDQIARAPGSSPVSELSPVAKKAWKTAKDRVLTKQQQEALSPEHLRGELDHWTTRLTKLDGVGALLSHSFRARFAAATLGTPFAEPTLYVHAIQALCQLAVHSLGEDQFGNVHRDVASIVRTLTSVIRKLEALKARFPTHWADTAGVKDTPEVDQVVDALRTGLEQVVTKFEPYSNDLRLSLGDVRLAKEAAAQPKAVEVKAKETEAVSSSSSSKNSNDKRKPEARRPQRREQTRPEMEQVRITIRNQDFDLDASTAGLEHQMAVATSPALHSVSVFCDGPGAYGDHFPLSMVAGGAPHLKEVVFFGCVRTWLPANPVPRLGSLTSLYLCSPEAGDLSHWAEHTDFKSLVSLSIVDYPLCPDDLHWLAGKERFPNLRQLNVQIPMEDTIDEEWCDEEVEAVNTFCKSLPCLEDITLYTDSQAHEIISCVLSRHGDSLKRLHLQDSCSRFDSGQGFTLDTFRNIRDRCPSLQYLRADVHRTFSDCQEAAIYQTISGMRCLRELVLCLKCCYVCWPGYYRDKAAEDLPPHWASYNMEPWPFRNHRATWLLRNGHIRDLLANSAFDESLARSIWDAIYDGGQGVRSLQSLSLHLKDNELLSAMKESPMWRQSRRLVSRLAYGSIYLFLLVVLLGLLLITPADAIERSISNNQRYNVLIVTISYVVTIFVVIFVYVLRLYINKMALTAIPKHWVPVDKGDVKDAVYKMIAAGLSRSALVAYGARPRVEERDEDGAIRDPPCRQSAEAWRGSGEGSGGNKAASEETAAPLPPRRAVWGEIEHPGWASPNSPDLPDLQYSTVLSELPNLIEAKALTMAPTDPESQTDPPMLDPEASALLQRQPHMSLRDYTEHLAELGVIDADEMASDFLSRFEYARFSNRPISDAKFREIMHRFAQLLRAMRPLDLDALGSVGSSVGADEDDEDDEWGPRPSESDIDNDAPMDPTPPSPRSSISRPATVSSRGSAPKSGGATASARAWSFRTAPNTPGSRRTGLRSLSRKSSSNSFAQTRRPYSLSHSPSSPSLRSKASSSDSGSIIRLATREDPDALPYVLNLRSTGNRGHEPG
ncbi:putative syntaxin-8B [Purpureocillium lavendulum]|uniref:Defect at low temperature protein 1 n=1 Tax=Purpureocillium lavendulum TaxID=1247861 RepID=A0AB34FTQ4_9HYPO|nr:putative syntaxin-8B [Purpureocillium lavendulum]